MKKSYIALLIILAGAQAHAVDYKPFATIDPKIEQRSDIAGTIRSLRTPLPTGGEQAFTLVTLSDVRLSLFNEIAAFLQTASQPGPYVAIDMKNPSPECMTNEAVARETKPVVKTDSSCSAVAQTLAQAYSAGFEKACRYTRQPLRFVEEQTPGDMTHENMQNIEGLISLPGEAFTHIRFPDNIVARAKLAQFSDIVAKIRTPKLVAALKANLTRFQQARASVAAQPSCVTSPTEVLKTLDLVAKESQDSLDRLAELDRLGRAQAAADLQKITANGRKREVLPFPSLSDDDRTTIAFFIGGIYWRMRGGGLIDDPPGTQETRLVYNKFPEGVIGEICGGRTGREAGESNYPRIFKGWGKYMDMGHTPGEQDRFYDLTFMTDRGLYQIGGEADILSRAGYDASSAIAGGLQMGPVYYFAWDKLSNIKIGEQQIKPYEWFLEGPTAWGEFSIGAALNLGLAKSLLAGHR